LWEAAIKVGGGHQEGGVARKMRRRLFSMHWRSYHRRPE
jgi:hypothetical protein